MPSGAAVIVEALREAGVDIVFGLPGVHNLPLWEALSASPIRLVCVRHEQAAAYAADGFSRATGRLGVALTTTGPGAANTLGAVGEAWASHSRVLVIATDIPSDLRRPGEYRGVLHETDGQAELFAPVTRTSAHGVEGVAAALAGPFPSYLEVPTDHLRRLRHPSVVTVTPEERRKGARVVAHQGARPLIWVEEVDRRDDVVALAERLGAPVIEAFHARGTMPLRHPLRVGLPPHVRAVGDLWDRADEVIAFGARFDGMMTQDFRQPQPPRIVALGPVGPNYDTVPATAVEGEGEDWADLRAVRRDGCRELDPGALRFLDALEFGLPPDANLVCDMCIAGYWAAGFHPVPEPRRLQYPVGWGTLGYAFPAAIGAAAMRPTVALCGDGGFLFATGELATVAQEQLPLTTVIVDDGAYGMLDVGLNSPDFQRLAEAFGLRAQTVEGLGDAFGEALAEHAGDPVPSVLVAKAQRLPAPPTTSPHWYRKQAV